MPSAASPPASGWAQGIGCRRVSYGFRAPWRLAPERPAGGSRPLGPMVLEKGQPTFRLKDARSRPRLAAVLFVEPGRHGVEP
jgi:hypothetical protein